MAAKGNTEPKPKRKMQPLLEMLSRLLPFVGLQRLVMPPEHLWVQDWLKNGHRRNDLFVIPDEMNKALAWWSMGLTADARRRAGRFRECIQEGRTTRASIQVAQAA